MKKRIVTGIVLALLLTGTLTLALNIRQVEAGGALVLEIEVSRTVLTIGKTASISLTLRNIGNTTITLPFRSSQIFDIFLSGPGIPIYAWSWDKGFLAIYWEATLHPGDTISQTLEWNFYRVDRSNGDHSPPEPGHYEIMGVCVGSWTWSDLLPIWLVPMEVIVPYDYSTIQEAINQANEGDAILVTSGTYIEHVVVNKTVSLIGESQNTTIINGNMTDRGIEVTANNVTVSGFTVQDSYIGIYLVESSHSIISDSSFSDLGYGAMLHNSTMNLISSNTICSNTIGLVISTDSSYNTVERNTLKNNTDSGIDIDQSSYNTILNNEISANGRGILLVGSTTTGNKVVENTISNSGGEPVPDGGIVFVDWPHGNVIYHNNFLYNAHQASISGSEANVWDNGFEGNFWSDYNGIDNSTPLDGIGDTPYVIDAINQDNYPFMNRYNPANINRDLKFDIKDVAIVGKAFGASPDMTNWNPKADITGPQYLVPDSRVDVRDLALVAKHFGDTYP